MTDETPTDPTPAVDAPDQEVADALYAVEKARTLQKSSGDVVERFDAETEIRLSGLRQDTRLKGSYGKALLWILGAQILLSNAWIYLYAAVGKSFDVPDGVVQAWLAASLVQVVGLVYVVVQHLFPNRDD